MAYSFAVSGKPYLSLESVTTNASLSGWGGVLQSLVLQGTLSLVEAKMPINILDQNNKDDSATLDFASARAPNQVAIGQRCGHDLQ